MCYIISGEEKAKFPDWLIQSIDTAMWDLYIGTYKNNNNVKYSVYTGENFYFLDKDGNALFVKQDDNDFITEKVARFTHVKDMPKLGNVTF